jgi:sulfate-transporting ATPase
VARQAKLQEELDKHDAWNLDSRLELAMDALRCPPGDTPSRSARAAKSAASRSTRLLLTEPDILLLDEPTNHLDAESVAWLEHHLRDYKGTVIAVTHDRYFLDNVAGWILELDRGYGIPYKGNYSSWLEQKQSGWPGRKAEASARRPAARAGVDAHVAKARRRPSARPASRLQRSASQEKEARREDLEIYIPPGPRLGDVVIRREGEQGVRRQPALDVL